MNGYFLRSALVCLVSTLGLWSVGCASTKGVSSASKHPVSAPDRSKLPSATAPSPWQPPEVESWKLDNGLEVYFLAQNQAPLAAVQLLLPHGAATDPADKAGLTAVMVDMLDEGAGNRDALALSEELQRLATDYSAGATRDSVSFSLNVLTDTFEASLGLLYEIMTRPTLTVADFQRIKAQRQASALTAEGSPGTGRRHVLGSALFGSGYGALPPGGTQDTLKRIRHEDILKQHAALIQPHGAKLVIVGALTKQEVQGTVSKVLGSWTGRAKVASQAFAPPNSKAAIHLVDYPGAAQSAISIAKLCEGMQSPHYFDDMVFNRSLGGAFVSRLNMNLREEKGWTYGARTAFVRYKKAGVYLSYANVKTDKTLASLQEMQREFSDFVGARPLSDQELKKATGGLLLGLPGRYETMHDVAGQIANVATYGLGNDWLRQWPGRVAAVTLESAQRAASRVLADKNSFAIIVAGDRAKIEASLRQLELPIILYNARGQRIDASKP